MLILQMLFSCATNINETICRSVNNSKKSYPDELVLKLKYSPNTSSNYTLT